MMYPTQSRFIVEEGTFHLFYTDFQVLWRVPYYNCLITALHGSVPLHSIPGYIPDTVKVMTELRQLIRICTLAHQLPSSPSSSLWSTYSPDLVTIGAFRSSLPTIFAPVSRFRSFQMSEVKLPQSK